MKDPLVVVAIIGVATTLATIIAGMITSRGNVGIKALELAIGNYQTENANQRDRIFAAEQRITDLTGQVNRCESDKTNLQLRVENQARRIDELERHVT